MRTIDADALKTDLTRFYDNEVTAKQLIDEQPTIDAIPVEWLRKKREIAVWQFAGAIDWLLSDWQKEQEAQRENWKCVPYMPEPPKEDDNA